MSLVRPEVAAALVRWREALAWGAALAVGLGLVWRGYARLEPLALVAGAAMAAAGFALLRGALARMRLAAAPGPGVVTVDEGRIGLWGPEGGGFADLDGLESVAVTGRGAGRAWALRGGEGEVLVLPFGARGAERIPDALAALPGFDLDAAAAGSGVVWRRERARLGGARPTGLAGPGG